MKKTCITISLVLSVALAVMAQANLTIINNSIRTMTIKIMEGTGNASSLYEIIQVAPYSRRRVGFTRGGYYFTKTMATLSGKDPVYRKGDSFRVVNDENGYSELTLTFTIQEVAGSAVYSGKGISKAEFERN